MSLKKRIVSIAIGIGIFAGVGIAAPDNVAACTDGIDCFCDRVGSSDIIMCEDFEDPNLPTRSGADRSKPGNWVDKYGPSVNQCLVDQTSPNFYTAFGTGSSQHCVDIVDETSATLSTGGCGVSGEGDCVLDGNHALGIRLRQGRTGGSVGSARWDRTASTFGYSMAVKFSTNYISPGSGGTSGPAHKMNEFGEVNAGLIGVGVGSGGSGRNIPFGGMLNVGVFQSYNVLVGTMEQIQGRIYHFGVDRNTYNFTNPGNWQCLQVHWSNWGTSNAEARIWMNEQLVFHATNINMSNLDTDRNGVGTMAWNHYYNGQQNSGYPGSTVAYRYEDNVVVTTANEPVSCGALGLDGFEPPPASPPPAPLPSQPPAAPVLLP